MPITNKNIIFDLDGTLIDSASSILAAFSYVFNLNHIQPIEPLSSSLIGPPLVTTLKLTMTLKVAFYANLMRK